MRKKLRKSNMKLVLLVLILSITIGYAFLNSNLNIIGISNIANATWDIHFENVQVNNESVSIGEGDSAARVNPNDNTEVDYVVTLNKPGDFYEFNVDVKNFGTIDGMVEKIVAKLSIDNEESFIVTDNPSNLPSYLNYSITYSDDTEIQANHELKVGEKETYKVRIEFKRDIEESDLLKTQKNLNFHIEPSFVQYDERIATSRPGYVITFDTDGGTEIDEISIERGSAIGELETPEKEGYYFDGWYTKKDNGEEIDSDYVPVGNKTIYAKWKKSVVSADTEETLSITKGETKIILINNAAEIDETYAFSSDDPLIASVSNDGVVTANGIGETNVVITGNISQQTKTIIVVVTKPQEYMITLDPNGGIVSNNAVFVGKGQAITDLPTPTRTQYTFDGWYTSLLNGIEIEDGYVSTGNIELVAKWIEKPEVHCAYEIPPENAEYDDYYVEGELYYGLEYTDGQYVYRYKQESNGSDWDELSTEGWGVSLIDKNSTDAVTTPLCTTINDKPVVSMANMFNGSNAVSIDTSSFNTSYVTNMNNMFANTSTLTLDVSNINTENVTSMKGMFSYTKVNKIDLRNFDTSNVSDMSEIFAGSYVNDLILDNLNLSSLYNDNDSYFDIFKGARNIERISAQNWIIGSTFKSVFNIPTLRSIDVTGWDLSNTYDIQELFAFATNLSEIKGLNTWNTSNIEDMSRMFYNCKSITELDLNGFESNNLYYISYMFNGCDNLEKLDLTGFNVVTYDSSDLLTTTKELELIIDDWNFENSYEVPNILELFPQAITISSKNWKLPEYASYAFDNNYSQESYLTRIDVTGWDLSNTTSIYGIFEENRHLTEIIGLETWDTSNITDMSTVFSNCDSLTEINGIDRWNTSNVVNMSYMFYDCSNIKNIDISNFKSDNLEYVNNMFEDCSKLERINISNFNITKASEYDNFLPNDVELVVIADNWQFDSSPNNSILNYLSGAKVLSCKNWILPESIDGLFADYSSYGIKEIDVTNWNLLNTTSINNLFYGNTELNTIIGLDTWDTSNVENMGYLFYECNSLTSIDLSNFNTSNVTEMSDMFNNDTELTTLDLSGFDTSNVVYMNDMFYNCPKLITIYATNYFNTENVSESNEMFSNDNLLVGGAGTTYDSEHTDKEYAHLDGGQSDPGYFSERATVKVTFNPNGGSTPISNKFVNNGSEVGELPVPTKYDGIFVGWYTDLIGGTQVETNSIINSNVTFYARWRTSVGAATFQNNKIELYPGTNANIVITNANEIEETYSFISNDSSIATVDSTGKVTGVKVGTTNISIVGSQSNQVKTVLIIVKENESGLSYTITYNPNGGTITKKSIQVRQGDKIGKLATPTREGYEFINWYTDLTSGVVVDEEYIPENNITIYARWKELPQHTLTFDANGGTVSESSRKVATGQKLGPLPTVKRNKYTFLGWYTALENGVKVDYDYTIDTDTTIHARWISSVNNLEITSSVTTKPGESKSIEIIDNYDSESYTIYSSNEEIAKLDEEGNVLGVNLGVTSIVIKGNITNITRKISVYVINDDTQSYTLTFNPNGGVLENTTKVVYENIPVGDLPTPERENYYFGGWVDEDEIYYTFNTMPTCDATLTAVWITSKGVARISDTYYPTLQEAIDAENYSGEKVVLMCDTEENIATYNNISLDLNGNKITGSLETLGYYTSIELISGTIEGTGTVISSSNYLTLGEDNSNISKGVNIIINDAADAVGVSASQSAYINIYNSSFTINNSLNVRAIDGNYATVKIKNTDIDINNSDDATAIDVMYGNTTINDVNINFNNTNELYAIRTSNGTSSINNANINVNNALYVIGIDTSYGNGLVNNTIINVENAESTTGIESYTKPVSTNNVTINIVDSDEACGITNSHAKITVDNTNIVIENAESAVGIRNDYSANKSTITNTYIDVSENDSSIGISGYDSTIEVENVTIYAKNKGIYADNVTINSGDIVVNNSDRALGLDCKSATMQDGTISVTSENDSADGISGFGTSEIVINGGTITVTAYESAMGIGNSSKAIKFNNGSLTVQSTTSDAYGLVGQAIYMYGGTITVIGPSDNKSHGFYWGGDVSLTGGHASVSSNGSGQKVYTA